MPVRNYDTNELKLELIGSNIMAGTWIISAVLRSFDHGKIADVKTFSVKKGRNSFDLSLLVSVGVTAVRTAVDIALHLRGEGHNRERDEEQLLRLKTEMINQKEELLALRRAIRFIEFDKYARLDKFIVNGIELSREAIDPESFRQLGLDEDEEDDKKYLK
ncbi:hypothetical protein Thermo_00133 [Thermoplasmatales archaeon]|nr:hypothetical protein Thermo_00133 [Thermoplasmatales archaeon]